jgi:hypothetical protein
VNRLLTEEEVAALALLSRRMKVLAIVLPEGTTEDYAERFARVVNQWLTARGVPPPPPRTDG